MSKLSDLKKEKHNQKEQEEEIIVEGVWRCAYCGTEFMLVIHPYYSNIPDMCINRQCEKNTLGNKRFIFIKWKIQK